MMEAGMNVILPDIPRLYTALAEWLACLICIFEMKRKFSGLKLAGISAGALLVQSVFLSLTGGMDDILWVFCMAAAAGMMYGFMWLCCDANAKDIGYYCVQAFVTAEFAASLEWQIDCYFRYALGWQGSLVTVLCLIVVYGVVYGGSRRLYRRYVNREEAMQVTNKELFSYVLIGLAVFLMSNLGFVSLETPFTGWYRREIFNIRTIIDFGGVVILYAYHVQRVDLRVWHELESVQNILHNQYVQYQQSQEAMDLIHYKYHDLKHHIIALRAEEDAGKRNAYLDKMDEEIRNYEAQNKTGNQVLDTLLTMKTMHCMKQDITMTCVVDGTLFSFMDVMDICSIFGNALDNAIEYEKKVKEAEKRLIHVKAYAQNRFLIIRFENYCEDKIDLREAFPATTKSDAQFHGYGLKSLKHTVKKYGGGTDIALEDNWFVLKILIPMESKEQK